MARFRPFRAVRFCERKIGSFDGVVAPPYDVIVPEAHDRLRRASRYNVVNLILNRDGHAAAASLYREWLASGVLVREPDAAFYLYRQDFESDGTRTRTGVIGALHLEPFSTGVVRPHERTFAHHKSDRLELTKQVQANLSAIFGLYSNAEFDPRPDGGWQEPPDVDVVHEGVRNRLWTIRSPERIAEITGAVADRTVFIADGHHRYETALNYFSHLHPGGAPAASDGPNDDEMPEAHVMAFLARFEDPGMLVLPTHRELLSSGGASAATFVVELQKRFDIERFPRSADGRERLLAALTDSGSEANAFGVAMRGLGEYLLLRRPLSRAGGGSLAARLDVAVLHSVVIEDALARAGALDVELDYSAAAPRSLDRVDSGAIEGVFLLRPTRPEQMAEICMAGELMPHKTTYFYPKLLTGLVFHPLTLG